MTHFGEVEPAAAQLEAAASSLRLTAGWAREGDRDAFMARLAELIDSQDGLAAERMRHAMPPDHVWLGLERYWRKRAERESAREERRYLAAVPVFGAGEAVRTASRACSRPRKRQLGCSTQ